ncbi:putative neural-cadherin-like [Scophthalmus maximus]|uniref:Putative neural-cadherin-like n=1 Tax=Scophthalmus maximus TaxID=52904 RepID=A0A2U9CGT5_SCOMX|nr:putative neural-cadherin-like [Scophthalmus maximus]
MEASEAGSYAARPGSRSRVDFKSYVARIIWEADNDGEALPPDAYHVWCVEGEGSSAGSLSSLGLSRWGPKFGALSEMYDRPRLGLSYQDAMIYIQRSHSHDPLPQHH